MDSIDRDSFSFRYPVTKSLSSALPKHFAFNVFYFADYLDPILDCLDGAMTGIEERWDDAAAIVFEAQRIIRDILSE
jgi:hypothetical protein